MVEVTVGAKPYLARNVLWMWAGMVWGMFTTPGAFLLPLGRMARALYATAWVESARTFSATIEGDLGASIGILQFNDVNKDIVRPNTGTDWRLSPFWSGVAAVRYVDRLGWSGAFRLLAPGYTGLSRWRQYWRQGKIEGGAEWLDASREAWDGWGWWVLTVVQYVAYVAAVLVAPPLALAYAVPSVIWSLARVR